MSFQFESNQFQELMSIFKGKPAAIKSRYENLITSIELCIKCLQLAVLFLASLIALSLAMKYDFLEKYLDLQLKEVQVATSKVNHDIAQMSLETAQMEVEIQSGKILTQSGVDCVFLPKERLSDNRYKWVGTFEITLTNNTKKKVDVTYSVLEFCIGTLDERLLTATGIGYLNQPATVFQNTDVSGNSISWTNYYRNASISEHLINSVEAKRFLSQHSFDRVASMDGLLVTTLKPGESTFISQEFIFNAEVGQYLGVACTYGTDDNFVKDEHDHHVIGYFELLQPAAQASEEGSVQNSSV